MNYTNRNQNIDIYFNEIRSNKSMTPEVEKELFARVAKGDQKATSEIFNRMAKMAVAVAKTYTCDATLLEDFIEEANMGILLAIPKFDISKGFRFNSYAIWWMKEECNNLCDTLQMVRVKSPEIMEKAKKIRKDFLKEFNREPSEYEVMAILEEQGEVVKDLEAITSVCTESFDELFADSDEDKEESGELALTVASKNAIEEEIDKEFNTFTIQKVMKNLDEREKRLVNMKYGIGRLYPMEYDQIAEAENELCRAKGITTKNGKPMTITSERVRQIVTGAIKKMQVKA